MTPSIRNARAFARAQAAYDNMTPDDDDDEPPECPECGAEMEWDKRRDEWVCGCMDEEEAEPGESQSEMKERV